MRALASFVTVPPATSQTPYTPAPLIVPWLSTVALPASAQTPGKIYLASSFGTAGMFVSTDAGLTWTQTGGSVYPADVQVDPNDDRIIYAAPGGRSTDGGLTFSAFDGGLDNVSSFYADFHMSYLGGSAPDPVLRGPSVPVRGAGREDGDLGVRRLHRGTAAVAGGPCDGTRGNPGLAGD